MFLQDRAYRALIPLTRLAALRSCLSGILASDPAGRYILISRQATLPIHPGGFPGSANEKAKDDAELN